MRWAELTLAFAAFFLSHSVPVRPPVRSWLVARLGRRGFTLAYSVFSLVILGWLIVAVGRAPFIPLWYWAPWQNHAALTVMLLVCLILALTIGQPNPFSFGGAYDELFDPAHPGLVRLTRHPLLMALALWGGVHMLANGDLAHVILFGAFTAFALMGGRLVDRRKKREMGPEWDRLWQATQAGQAWPVALRGTLLRLLAGFGLFGSLVALHPVVLGVSPLP